MQEMLRKKYRLSVEFFGRFRKPKLIYFDFLQGTLREILEMKNELSSAEKIDAWLMDFLINKTTQSEKLTPKLYYQLAEFERNNILDFIIKTFAKGFFTKEEGIENKTANKAPTSSMICLILKETGESMESVLGMTWEQIEYIIEGIVWNLNATDKKGQQRNEKYMRMKEVKGGMTDEEAEELKKLNERMNQKL